MTNKWNVILQIVTVVSLAGLGALAMFKLSDNNVLLAIITAMGVCAGSIIVSKEVNKQ